MKYRLGQKSNPAHPEDPRKWHAIPVNAGTVKTREIAKIIAGRSSLTAGDVENAVNNYLDEAPTFLKIGMSVQMGNFGTFRVSLSSEGTDSPEEFTAAKIKGARVIFTPSRELKKALEDITFEEQK